MRNRHVALRVVALLATGCGLALAAPAAAGPTKSTVEAAADRCPGGLYQVHTVHKHRSSTLVAVDPGTGQARRVADLDHAVNAMGYDAAQGLFVGVATRHKGHPIGDGGHIVTITPAGETRDLGPVRGVSVAGAYSGTAAGGRLLLLLDGDLVAVDLRSGSPTLVRRLDLPRLLSFGDWDARPGDGGLYAVSTQGRGPSRLVRVDPASGAVTQTPAPGLPGEGFFGAVAFDDTGRHLYATDNNDAGTLYRIALDGTATKLARGAGLLGSDAAWCRGRRPNPPAPRPTTAPAPPREPVAVPPPAAPRPVPPPSTRPAARPPVTAPPPPSPTPTPVAVVRASRKRAAGAEPRDDDRTTTVRWGIVLLVLGLGSIAHVHRRRARPR